MVLDSLKIKFKLLRIETRLLRTLASGSILKIISYCVYLKIILAIIWLRKKIYNRKITFNKKN